MLITQSVRDFLSDSYQLISPSSPTIPLQGNDQVKALQFLNELVSAYSATGLMLTVAREVVYNLVQGTQSITFGDPSYVPTPTITSGRLANLINAWLILDGVTYPLDDESRNTFFYSYKYDPLLGLPRIVIVEPNDNLTTLRIYPAPSQGFELHIYGKFEFSSLTLNDDMSSFPTYFIRYLRFALARDLSFYKGRSEAWTSKLELMLKEATEDMESVSSYNLNIESDEESYLNGSWRLRAGI